MKLRILLLCCFCCWSVLAQSQLSFSPPTAAFGNVTKGSPATLSVSLQNTSSTDFVVTDLDLFHTETFSFVDSAFTIPAGGSHTVVLTCDPRHNISYDDFLLVKSTSHPVTAALPITAMGKFEAYYNGTDNLWDENLEDALTTIVGAGYVSLTYNDARDKMYMIIDNEAVNGQGATQNTIECVYTGFRAIGYTSRSDAQNTFSLSTEHTMPQSLFNSSLPMLSDIHHLFVATVSSNGERADNPFGVVTNPTWSVGGSKSNGNLFEPRDVQKGPTSRALLYYLIRYGDINGYICAQQAVLLNWHDTYPPDAREKNRSDDVFTFQHNHNPWVDHPEFIERMTNLCGNGVATPSPTASWTDDTLEFGNVQFGANEDGYYAVANVGTADLHLSNISISDPAFAIVGSPSTTLPADSLRQLWIRFTPGAANQTYSATLTFNTDAANTATRTVTLLGNSAVVGTAAGFAGLGAAVFPQPAGDKAWFQCDGLAASAELHLVGLQGQQLRSWEVPYGQNKTSLDLQGLARGLYFLQLDMGGQVWTEKLIVE